MAEPPFALFITAEDGDLDYINDSLTRSWRGNEKAAWNLWLATNNYDEAPKERLAEGTQAPVSSYTSPWAGKTLDECAHWLQDAGERVKLHRKFFAAMDQYSREDDTILICRIGSTGPSDPMTLQYYPVETEFVVAELISGGDARFDERLQNYQRSRMMDGKPDRSKGKPIE
ncbi:MAG: hypothetical protein Q9160_006548 [Pyrenula sp. 1 TL-2023]